MCKLVEKVEHGGNGEEQKKKEWQSIKVEKGVHENLKDLSKDMGVGIGKAVEVLVETRRSAVTKKIEDISEISGEIADILLESGLLDIKFKGAGIENASIDGDCLFIHGYISVEIPDASARKEIYEVLSNGMERQNP